MIVRVLPQSKARRPARPPRSNFGAQGMALARGCLKAQPRPIDGGESPADLRPTHGVTSF